MQHLVAEPHRQEHRQLLEIGQLRARRLSLQAVGNAHRHLPVAPHVEHCGIVPGQQVVASGIDDARDAEAIQLSKEGFGAFDLLRGRGLRQSVEERDHRCVVAGNRTGCLRCRVAFQATSGRKVRVGLDPQCLERVISHHDPAVSELDVDRVVRRRSLELGLRRPALLDELLFVPSTRDDQPRPGRLRPGGLSDPSKRFGER